MGPVDTEELLEGPTIAIFFPPNSSSSKQQRLIFDSLPIPCRPNGNHLSKIASSLIDTTLPETPDGKQQYDEKFVRMWDFYLCNCEAEFLTGHFGLGHFVFKRPSGEYRPMAQQRKILDALPQLQQMKPDKEILQEKKGQ